MKAVEKRGWTPFDMALLNTLVWSNEVRDSKPFVEDDMAHKDSVTMELAEDFAGVSWKELYLQKSFHHRMTSFTTCDTSSLLPLTLAPSSPNSAHPRFQRLQ